jgi:hypothetical protein
MSKYYKVKGLKVRVSDHEPNDAMRRIRGRNDLEIYSKSVEGKKLSIVSQVNRFLNTPLAQSHGIVKSDFNEVLGKKNKKVGLISKYKTIDDWFDNPEQNKHLISDLRRNPKWFIPVEFNQKQKTSWLKYLEKKLSSID